MFRPFNSFQSHARLFAIWSLPALSVLDSEAVSLRERRDAEQRFNRDEVALQESRVMEAEEEKQKTDKQLQNTRLLLIRVRSCSLIKYTHPIFEELPQAMSCFFEEDIVTLSGERCRVNNFVRHISSKYLKWTRNIRF